MVRVYWKAIGWSLLVILVSILPAEEIPGIKFEIIPHFDKVVHFIMYAILTILILQKNHVLFGKIRQTTLLIFTALYAFFLGFFLELIQNCFLIGRIFDIFDVMANTIGILVSIVFFKIFNH